MVFVCFMRVWGVYACFMRVLCIKCCKRPGGIWVLCIVLHILGVVGCFGGNVLFFRVMTTLTPEPAGNETEVTAVKFNQALTKKANTEAVPGDPADKQVIVRVTAEMRDFWKAAAQASGVTLSEFIRDLVQTGASDVLECQHPQEALRQYPWSTVCLKCGQRLAG